jgi:sugar lactone lactonase YvrE
MSRVRNRMGWALGAALVVGGVVAAFSVPPALAQSATNVIVLPDRATSAEGIAVGAGSTFYAGDLFAGDIFRGDLQRGSAELFIDAPDGRMAVGLKADVADDLLFAAGGLTGQGYVYDLSTGTDVATYQFGAPNTSFVNDVFVTRDGAWFTDSFQPKLYFVPLTDGVPGQSRSLTVTGPAAAGTSGAFNLNGIVVAPDGRLIVAHTAQGALYTVDPATGASTIIAGVSVPNVDGIVLQSGRLWAVQNFDNKVTRWNLSADLISGVLDGVITSGDFKVPTTAALHGDQLAAVNARFDTGFPPTADHYQIVIVDR